jgi:hypothetical protein
VVVSDNRENRLGCPQDLNAIAVATRCFFLSAYQQLQPASQQPAASSQQSAASGQHASSRSSLGHAEPPPLHVPAIDRLDPEADIYNIEHVFSQSTSRPLGGRSTHIKPTIFLSGYYRVSSRVRISFNRRPEIVCLTQPAETDGRVAVAPQFRDLDRTLERYRCATMTLTQLHRDCGHLDFELPDVILSDSDVAFASGKASSGRMLEMPS